MQLNLISILTGKFYIPFPLSVRQLFSIFLFTLFLSVICWKTEPVVYAGSEFDGVLDGLRKGSESDTSREALDDFFSAKTTRHKTPKPKATKPSQEKSTKQPTPSVSKSTANTTSTSKPSGDKLFNSVEFRGKIKKLPKWSKVLSKMNAWEGYLNDPKTKGLSFLPKWGATKAKAESLSKKEKIKAVNSYFNKWPYRTDINNYGKNDYWASPPEFLRKSGDCEDYAIAKFYGLKELGFTNEEMRIVALKDTIRNLGHAILVVYLDGDILVLDNQTNMLLSHTKYKHYKPAYSVNEQYRWMHVTPMKKKK